MSCLWGCAPLAPPEADLKDASREHALRLRWNDFEGAARHVEESLRDDFLNRFRGEEDLRIVEVRRESIRFEPQGSRALVRMMVEYYRLPSLRVEKITFSQEWTLLPGGDSRGSQWRITAPFPEWP